MAAVFKERLPAPSFREVIDRPSQSHVAGDVIVTVSPTGVGTALLICALTLIAAHVAMLGFRYAGHDSLMGGAAMIDLWQEQNIPTFVSAVGLTFCSLLLLLNSMHVRLTRDRFHLHWVGLAAIFAFLGADEMLGFHDALTAPVRALLDTHGSLYNAWVIPYGAALVLVAGIYLPFLLGQHPVTRWLFILSAVTYIGGAMGVEILGSSEWERVGARTPLMEFYNGVEETLEMLGIVAFAYSLTRELARRQVSIRFRSDKSPDHSGQTPANLSALAPRSTTDSVTPARVSTGVPQQPAMASRPRSAYTKEPAEETL